MLLLKIAIVINVIWNRSFGLGGSTRRLHQKQIILWGRNRIDMLNKEIIFTRYYSPLEELNINKCKR